MALECDRCGTMLIPCRVEPVDVADLWACPTCNAVYDRQGIELPDEKDYGGDEC